MASATIITVTLSIVAAIASLIIKRENDFCRLKATRRAMKPAVFKRHGFIAPKIALHP
jgi:hypothetical protein